MTTRSPGRETSKGKGREVEEPQTPKNNKQQNVTGRISRYAQYVDSDDEVYEDVSESEIDSPTPTEEYKGPRLRDGTKTLRSADHQWTALEAEDAQQALLKWMDRLMEAAKTQVANGLLDGRRIALLDLDRPKIMQALTTMEREGRETKEAIGGLATKAAAQLDSLTSKVDLLVKTRNNDNLERKVEELSGQLVSLAQRSQKQQELLNRILEKASALPKVQVQVPATPAPRTPCPHPTPAITREVAMQDPPVQAAPPPSSAPPPPPPPPPPLCRQHHLHPKRQ